jgi:hypothetical protein
MSRSRKKNRYFIIGGDRKMLRRTYRRVFKQAEREGQADNFPKFAHWSGWDYIDYRWLELDTTEHNRCRLADTACAQTYACPESPKSYRYRLLARPWRSRLK